jgi:trimeric autotransporter adhesin
MPVMRKIHLGGKACLRKRTLPPALKAAKPSILIVLFVAAVAPSLWAQYCGPINAQEQWPNGRIPAVAEVAISGFLGTQEGAYQAVVQNGHVHMDNSGMYADFRATGVEFRVGGELWRIALRAYGYGDRWETLDRVAPLASANRVEYVRGALTEWYVNGPFGVEQGFTLHKRLGNRLNEPLTLAFAISGDLVGTVDADGRGLSLGNKGLSILRYGDVSAVDANGRALKSWIQVSGSRLWMRINDGGARYPITVDPFVQAAQLTACDGDLGDRLGWSTATSADGQTIIAGANDSSGCPRPFCIAGAAYVFPGPSRLGLITPFANIAIAKLVASDAYHGEEFGWSIGLSADGSTIAVGAPGGVIDTDGKQGAIYVFVRPPTGWARAPRTLLNETAKLTASDGGNLDGLGFSVAVSADGGTIVGGAVGQGAAYVFVRPVNGWVKSTQTAKLTASGGPTPNNFGYSVGITDNAETIAVGAPDPTSTPGAVYVFVEGYGSLTNAPRRRSLRIVPPVGLPRAWANSTETAKLIASDGIADDRLGLAVAISGDGGTVIAGADATIGSNQEQGAAYVFSRPSTGWASSPETAKLTASDGSVEDGLGLSLGVTSDGSTVAAGAPYANISSNEAQGAVYVFNKSASGWSSSSQTAKLTSSGGQGGDGFGYSANIDEKGDKIITGAPGVSASKGAIYVFTSSASTLQPLSTASLSFSGAAGAKAAIQSVTLTNRGDSPLHLTSVSVTGDCLKEGACAVPFSSTRNCLAASPLPPGAQCTEVVSFTPTSPGSFTASLAFVYDSGTRTVIEAVQLHGTAAKAGAHPRQHLPQVRGRRG